MSHLQLSNEAIDLYNEGNTRYAQRDYDGAIRAYTQALQLAPHFLEARGNLGNAYSALGRYTEALAEYQQACELSQSQPNMLAMVYYNRGTALEMQGDLSQALSAFNQAISLNPQFTWAYGNRGHILSRLHKHVEAMQDYDQAFTLGPNDVNAAWTFTWVHMELTAQGQRKEAIQALLRITRLDPQDPISTLCQGVVALLQSHAHEALSHCGHAEEQGVEKFDAAFWRGMILAYQGKGEPAQQALEHALTLGLPPILLRPLRWIQVVHPSFASYVADLFRDAGLPDTL
jgi:tetratricopeptide (TPR) repeat protein